jgi:hypothetical protein
VRPLHEITRQTGGILFQARIARDGAGDVDAVVLSNTNPSQTAKTIETNAASSRAGGMTNDTIPITARMIAR